MLAIHHPTADPPPAEADGPALRPKLSWDRGWAVARSLGAAVLLFALLRAFVVQVYGINSGSMQPTLRVGDFVVTNNTIFGAVVPFTGHRLPALRQPQTGEVVVYRPSGYSPVEYHIKRIIGEPGDVIQMIRGTVYRNGTALREPYAKAASVTDVALSSEGPYNYRWQLAALPAHVNRDHYAPTRDNWGPVMVPAGEYLMLGDDRAESIDSRYTGFVPRHEILGKVLVIHWSSQRGRVGNRH